MADFRCFLVILFGLFVASYISISISIDAAVDTTVLENLCNGDKFWMLNFLTPGAVSTILDLVIQGTPKSDLLDYYASNTQAEVYAHGLCATSLSPDDCSYCLKSARGQMMTNCSTFHVGAQINLRDCRLRFEIYAFHDDH